MIFHQYINLVLFNILQRCIYWSVFYFPSSRNCLELRFQYPISLSSLILFLFRILRHWISDTFCLIFISIHFYECVYIQKYLPSLIDIVENVVNFSLLELEEFCIFTQMLLRAEI